MRQACPLKENMQYGVYIVRIWLEPSAGELIWRASATDIESSERRFFTTREALACFLGLEQLPEPSVADSP